MTTISEKQKIEEIRKRLSIEICDNFTKRLNPKQKNEIKMGALIAIRNFIKNSKIDDPILYSFLVDAITDNDKEIRDLVIKIIKEVVNPAIIELLEIKLNEITTNKIKGEIKNLLRELQGVV